MENLDKIRYYRLKEEGENDIFVRVRNEVNLEYLNSEFEWIPNQEWFVSMFYDKDIDYEAINSNIVENKINGRYGYQQNKVNKVCYRPFMKMAVRFDGTVTAACCDMSHEVVFGNIRDHTLNDIWNGESHRNFLRMQLQGKRFLHEICKNCCIPNDLSFKEDYLDPYADELLKRF